MQTHSAFTDSLSLKGRLERTSLFITTIAPYTDRGTRTITPQIRRDLIDEYRRKNILCSECGQELGAYDDHLHIDHIVPKSKGGSDDLSNLQVIHRLCNLRKSNKLKLEDT